MIELISDGLLLLGTMVAALYCFILSKKLKKLSGFESGLGGAIAVLSKQVDDMQKVLKETEATSLEASEQLQGIIDEAHTAAEKLEVVLAGLGDLPEPAAPKPDGAPKPDVVSFVTGRARQ